MHSSIHPLMAATTCTKTATTASLIVGWLFLLGIVGAIVGFAVANSQARKKLAVANAELNYLRPEIARLHQLLAGSNGGPPNGGVAGSYPGATSMPAQWYPDPSGRHELRHWDGSAWTDQVSDKGETSTDPAVG